MRVKWMQLFFIPILILLNSCAGLIGGIAGGTAGAKGPDPDKIQTVALRSRYKVDCITIKEDLADFISRNKEISTGSPDVGYLCHEINSKEDIFKSCIKVDPQDEYRIADGTFWSSYDFYLIQIQKKGNDCNLLFYTKLDFDLKGNPLVTKPDCQNGYVKKCEEKFEVAKVKRDKIKSSIEKRSRIVFQPAIEEKIFNYYGTEKALKAFEN